MNKSYDTVFNKVGPSHRYKATPTLFRSLHSWCLLTGSIVGLLITVQAVGRTQTAPSVDLITTALARVHKLFRYCTKVQGIIDQSQDPTTLQSAN